MPAGPPATALGARWRSPRRGWKRRLATVPLAIVAQEIAGRAGDPALRLDALRLWARFDPARAAYAQSLVVDTLAQGTAAGVGDEPVRQALGELVAAAPMATAFWALAARETAAGRKREAADALERGASAWSASELGPALQKLADALRSDAPASWPAAVPGRRRPKSAPASETTLSDAPEVTLAHAPADPAALALVTLNAGSDPARLATIYTGAAAAHGPGEKLWRLQAIHWLGRAGRATEALEAARALHQSEPAWAPGRELCERLVRVMPDPLERARALVQLGFSGDPGAVLRAAEAHETAGDDAAAGRLYRDLGGRAARERERTRPLAHRRARAGARRRRCGARRAARAGAGFPGGRPVRADGRGGAAART